MRRPLDAFVMHATDAYRMAEQRGWLYCNWIAPAARRGVSTVSQLEPIAGLLLDEENPRFAKKAAGQAEALTAILEMSGQKVLNLAQDIVAQDAVNPSELPIAVAENGSLVVIEGNRRLAALKLLRDPELAKDASTQVNDYVQKFKTLAKSGVGPDSIEVFLADSRDAARHWIELRHTGENNGVGVVEWESWQANNYRRRRGSQADRATVFCEAVEREFPDEADLLADVDAVRKKRLTTLGRLVADPAVRQDFGFDFNDDGVIFDYESEDLLAGISRIFADLAGSEVSVTDIKTKKNRADYVTKRATVLPKREKKLARPRRAGEAAEATSQDKRDTGGDKGETTKREQKKEKKSESTPERVIFQGMRLPNVSVRIQNLLKQAQRIDIDGSAQVTAILIRVIVELVVTDAISRGAVKGNEGDKLKQKIGAALLSLDPECKNPIKRDKSLEMAWTRTQMDDGMAVQSLHAFVHNTYGAATPSEVREFSLMFRGMLERLDAAIGGQS